MKLFRIPGSFLLAFIAVWFPFIQAAADGGYVSAESVAVSADQRAIITKNGDRISITFSTGYTGEGEDFGWIIPSPVPPLIEDVQEGGENVRAAFQILDKHTSPTVSSGGCFPAGTEVLAAEGPRAIETVEPGTEVWAYDLSSRKWQLKSVMERHVHLYDGEIVTIRAGQTLIQATGNHPFYIVQGQLLSSRPPPVDVPAGEQNYTPRGRWVEARHLIAGDALLGKGGKLTITSLGSRWEQTTVYNLTVEHCHTYAVAPEGVLVHNKGGAEGATGKSEPQVIVHGTAVLANYEVSVLGAGAASDLIEWLQGNGYQVNPDAREILNSYIERGWAFVAVKLNPDEKRRYRNEFLPPLTVKYRSDQLIFPLYISSISTRRPARITLYIFAESTVRSGNFPTRRLLYKENPPFSTDVDEYIESCLADTVGPAGARLAVMWSGRFDRRRYPREETDELLRELMKTPFETEQEVYLTRLETRMEPEAMTDDIHQVLDHKPGRFQVHLYPGAESTIAVGVKVEPGIIRYAATRETSIASTFLLSTRLYGWDFLPAYGVDGLFSIPVWGYTGSRLAGLEVNYSLLLITAGVSLVWEITEADSTPCLGFRLRFLDVPPIPLGNTGFGLGFDLLPFSVRWNLETGKPIYSIGLGSVVVGYSSF